MRTTILFAVILGLTWPFSVAAEHSPSSYSTLVVEFVGEMDRPVFNIVLSTSREEGRWYKDNLYEEGVRDFVDVFVMPKSTLAEITEAPLLKNELRKATRYEQMPNSSTHVRFVVGIGHDHKEIMLDAPTSAGILRDAYGRVSKYPGIESQIQEILYALKGSGG